MFIASTKGNARFCSWSEMPTKRKYKIGLLYKADPYSSREVIAEAYSKGIAWRIYHDLLNVYDAQSLVVW
jgi:hypothetical protein